MSPSVDTEQLLSDASNYRYSAKASNYSEKSRQKILFNDEAKKRRWSQIACKSVQIMRSSTFPKQKGQGFQNLLLNQDLRNHELLHLLSRQSPLVLNTRGLALGHRRSAVEGGAERESEESADPQLLRCRRTREFLRFSVRSGGRTPHSDGRCLLV